LQKVIAKINEQHNIAINFLANGNLLRLIVPNTEKISKNFGGWRQNVFYESLKK
jgi:hypothetical protein